ncbi:MAG: isoamylase early set domain-containing protein [Deltaproteobacteria bacterium]|nr:isoamylase early set domain-containing protein [Deltaproteobacteria bacterium]
MPTKKQYLKKRPVCKVTFRLDAKSAGKASSASLAGDFNGWRPAPMERLKSGDFKAVVDLSPGRHYEYRFVVDGGRWINDPEADRYVPGPYGDENCVAVT